MYQQVDRILMGSPLGTAIANIFVGYYEKKSFETTHKPKQYIQYVDYMLTMFLSRSEVEILKFTCEFEVNNSLPILYILIKRCIFSKLSTYNSYIYIKKTKTNLLVS